MRICIVGGALQGMELAYLSMRAGYDAAVMDRRPDAPALSMCGSPLLMDPVADPEGAKEIFEGFDAVIPACENDSLLEALCSICPEADVPLLFDMASYRISRSKIESNRLMHSIGVPIPQPWPDCGFPVIVKPSGQSGSVGVSVAKCQQDLEKGLETVRSLGDEPVIQEFVSGKSVSVEVIGDGSASRSYVTTEVCLDSNYDCKMVRCNPDILSWAEDDEFGRIGRSIADAMHLNALMDVEAIRTERGLRVLEVDARFPSQTPAAIEAATGINLLSELVSMSMDRPSATNRRNGSSVYRHVVFKDGMLRACGEKEFSKVRSPTVRRGLFGSDYTITDYSPGSKEWRATIIVSAGTRSEADRRSDSVISRMMDECGAESFADRSPEMI